MLNIGSHEDHDRPRLIRLSDDIEIHHGIRTADFDTVLVVLKSDNGYVLARNSARGWEFPGGHREQGETYHETALRETFEETGLVPQDVRCRGFYIISRRHRTIYVTAHCNFSERGSLAFETHEVAEFQTFPEDLSFPDGLYQALVGLCAVEDAR